MQRLTYVFISVCLLLGTTSYADRYYHGGAGFDCDIWATKLTLYKAEKRIGGYQFYLGFQAFRSKDQYDHRLVVFKAGNLVDIQKMFESPVLPDEDADANWTILEDKKETRWDFQLPKTSIRIPFEFKIMGEKLNRSQFFIQAKTDEFTPDLEEAREILVALGDKETPDFVAEKPSIKFSPPRKISMTNGVTHPPGTKLPLLFDRDENHYSFRQDVQIHYPVTKREGLSYHIHLSCHPLKKLK